MLCANYGGGGGVLRRTRSSRPWALSSRHPWRVTSGVTRRHRRLMARVHRGSKHDAHFAGTGALSIVTGMVCPSALHVRLDVDPRTKSHGRVRSGGGGSVRRTITRHGWRVVR